MKNCRAIRGAISVDTNTPAAIISATRQLLERMVAVNQLMTEDLVSVIFTATKDLDAAYPACAARDMGWTCVPLLCMQEMHVPDSLPKCIRVLVHWNTAKTTDQIQHVYLGKAQVLRPDLVEERGS